MPSNQTPAIQGPEAFLNALRDPGRNLKERYRGDPLGLAKRFGVKLPQKPVLVMLERGVITEEEATERFGEITPGLREMVSDVCSLEVRSAVAVGPRGGGKQLLLETPVPTPTGWTTMGEIRAGDWVFNEAGVPTRVTIAHDPVVPEKAYRLTFSDGTHIDADGEHLWQTWNHKERSSYLERQKRTGGNSWEMPEDWPFFRWPLKDRWGNTTGERGPEIRTTQEIAETLTFGEREDTNHCIPLAQPLDLPERNLPVYPWLLGYWLGNGSDNGVITAGSKDGDFDGDFIESMIRHCWSENFGRTDIPEKGATRFNLRSPFVQILRSAGIKSGSIPKKYLRASEEQRLALLRGLCDSDGYVDPTKSRVEFCTTHSRKFAEQVLELVRTLGERPVLSEGRATLDGEDMGPKWRVCWRPRYHNPFLLPRKASGVTPIGEVAQGFRHQHRMIVSCEEIEPKMMRCITVDSPAGLFLCGEGMIPTHNSFGVSFIEFYLWMVLDFDALNLGGSELQADQVYRYILGYMEEDEFWLTLVKGDPQRERTYTVEDSWVRVLTASSKSVRSPHAGGMRKGKLRGGVLVIDEEAEAEKDIVESALPTINTARPSVNLRVSTFHNLEGSFQEVVDNHKEMGYCADNETEILTQRGWLHGEELQPWDLALSVDAAGNTHWSKIKSIYRDKNYSGPMLRIKQRYLSALVNAPHRLMLSDGSFTTAGKVNSPYSQVAGWRDEHNIRLIGGAAPDGPGVYSNDFVELVAWFVSEGHWIHSTGGKKVWNADRTAKEYRYYKGKIKGFGISQNPGPELERIRLILKRLNQAYTENTSGGCTRLNVRGQILHHLLSICEHNHDGSTRRELAENGKALSAEFCTSLTQEQRIIFLDTFMAGDGSEAPHHIRNDGTQYVQRTIGQHEGRRSDSIQMICTLAGIPTRQSKNVISLRTTTETVVYDKHIEEQQYEGLVWCPETEHGTWVSRRDGVVSLTGNTKYSWDIFDVLERCDCVGVCQSEEPCFREDHYEDYIDADTGELKRRLIHKSYCGGRGMYADGWIPLEEAETLWRRMRRNHSRWEVEAMGSRPSTSGFAVKDLNRFAENIVDEKAESFYLPGSPIYVTVDWGTGAAGVCVWQSQPGKEVLLHADQIKDNNQTQMNGIILGYAARYQSELIEIAADIGGGGNYMNPSLRQEHRQNVRDVNFNEEKEAAIAAFNIKNESGEVLIPAEHTEFIHQIRNWKRKNGRIQKGNDHLCDAGVVCHFSRFIDEMGLSKVRIAPRSFHSNPDVRDTPVSVSSGEGGQRSRRARVPVARTFGGKKSRRR